MDKYNVAAGDNDFGLSLLSQVEKGNAVVSPYNIRSALALLYEGATQETAKEIAAVAGFSEDRPAQRQAFRSLIDSVNKSTAGYTLKSANGLWIAQNYPVKQAFLSSAKDDYRARTESADFENNAEGARGEINGWVSDNTEQKIPELFPE